MLNISFLHVAYTKADIDLDLDPTRPDIKLDGALSIY